MKLHIKWFAITMMIVWTLPAFIIFIWCSATGFGADIVKLFESVHPSGGLSIISKLSENKSFISFIPGILINTIYMAVDSFIGGFVFSFVYNLFLTKFEKE